MKRHGGPDLLARDQMKDFRSWPIEAFPDPEEAQSASS
jgi:hypothetical protein